MSSWVKSLTLHRHGGKGRLAMMWFQSGQDF
jgi:hypothetical protein